MGPAAATATLRPVAGRRSPFNPYRKQSSQEKEMKKDRDMKQSLDKAPACSC